MTDAHHRQTYTQFPGKCEQAGWLRFATSPALVIAICLSFTSGCAAWRNRHLSELSTPAPPLASVPNDRSGESPSGDWSTSGSHSHQMPSNVGSAQHDVGSPSGLGHTHPRVSNGANTSGQTSNISPSDHNSPAFQGYCSASFQRQFGWPDPEKAARVCQCESGGDPQVVSRNGLYHGLFQFSRDTWEHLGGGDVFDPELNSRRAFELFEKRGWKPWPACARKASISTAN